MSRTILGMITERFGRNVKIKEQKHALVFNTNHIGDEFSAFLDECGISYSRITDNGFIVPIKRN